VPDEARHHAVELAEHLLPHRSLALERLLMAAGGVEPHEDVRQVDERDAVLADDLQPRRRPEVDGLLPHPRHVVAATDLREHTVAGPSGLREVEAHHLVVVDVGARRLRVPHGHDARGLDASHVAAPVDEFHQVPRLAAAIAGGGRPMRREEGHPAVAEQHPWLANLRGDQFLEADGGRSVATRQFRHERDPRLLDASSHDLRLLGVEGQRDRRVDGLAMVAGREDGRGTEPLVGQVQDGVDVVSGGEGPKAVHGGGSQFRRGSLRPMGHLLADSSNLESIAEGAQRRQMPALPEIAQSHDTDAQLHGVVSADTASAARSSRSRCRPLSAISFRHHAPSQRMCFTAV
jgi:hypothetical protein